MTDEESKDALILHLERAVKENRMLLRDQFAMASLSALVPDFWHDGSFAEAAYEIADAMMEARLK